MDFNSGSSEPPRPPDPNSLQSFEHRHRQRRLKEALLEDTALDKMMLTTLDACAIFTSVGTALFCVTAFADQQFTPTEILLAVLLFGMIYLGVRFLYRYGFIRLVRMAFRKRQKVLPIYAAIFAVATVISAASSAYGVLGDPVRQHHLQEVAIETGVYASRTIAQARQVFGMDAMVEGKAMELVTATDGEVRFGNHCGSLRSGNGICGSLLQSLSVTTDNANSALGRAAASAAPLILRLENEIEDMRRVAGQRDGISYAEKRQRLETHLAQIALMTRQLQQLVPISTLEGLAADWSRDYSTAGMTAQGQDRLNTTLGEPARELTTLAQDTRHAFSLSPPEIAETNVIALVAKYFDRHWLLVIMSLFPDLLATSLILINFVTARKPGDDEFDPYAADEADSGGNHGGTGSGGLQPPAAPATVTPISRPVRTTAPEGFGHPDSLH